MNTEAKRIYIDAIINHIGEHIKAKNKKLAAENLHDRQEPFDYGEWFIKLAFMDDETISHIVKKVLK